MVHELSRAPCAVFKILATRRSERIRLRMKNSTRWLVLVRDLATALGLSRAAALWATKIPCVMRNPQGLGNRLPQPIADMGKLHDSQTPPATRGNAELLSAQQFESVLSSS